jgi:hypothetical protein
MTRPHRETGRSVFRTAKRTKAGQGQIALKEYPDLAIHGWILRVSAQFSPAATFHFSKSAI